MKKSTMLLRAALIAIVVSLGTISVQPANALSVNQAFKYFRCMESILADGDSKPVAEFICSYLLK